MKKLLIGLLVFGSVASYAADDCSVVIKENFNRETLHIDMEAVHYILQNKGYHIVKSKVDANLLITMTPYQAVKVEDVFVPIGPRRFKSQLELLSNPSVLVATHSRASHNQFFASRQIEKLEGKSFENVEEREKNKSKIAKLKRKLERKKQRSDESLAESALRTIKKIPACSRFLNL